MADNNSSLTSDTSTATNEKPAAPPAPVAVPGKETVQVSVRSISSDAGAHTATTSALSVDLGTFRTLFGIPEDYKKGYQKPKPWGVLFSGVGRHPHRESSIYYTLIDEERQARFVYSAIDVLVYSCSALSLPLNLPLPAGTAPCW